MAEGLFNESMTLAEIDNVLERTLSENRQEIRIIADLSVTEDDYNILIKELAPVKSNITLLRQYQISVVTAWVFALHYGDYGKAQGGYIVEEWAKIPQYSLRQFMALCNSVFIDYGVVMHFTEIHNEKEFFNTLVAHAGIPERISGSFCILLEDLVRTKDMDNAIKRMNKHAEGMLSHVADLATGTFLQDLLNNAANIMYDCKQEQYSETDLQRRYPLTSSKLIHICLDWVKKQKKGYQNIMQCAV